MYLTPRREWVHFWYLWLRDCGLRVGHNIVRLFFLADEAASFGSLVLSGFDQQYLYRLQKARRYFVAGPRLCNILLSPASAVVLL